jgi:hypothetical protein
LLQRIELGIVTDRTTLIKSLEEVGEVTRQGSDYVSVKPFGFNKAVRLKGLIYGEVFKSCELDRQASSKERAGFADDRDAHERAAQTARREYEKAVRRRASYNFAHFRASSARALGPSGKETGRAPADSSNAGNSIAQRDYKPNKGNKLDSKIAHFTNSNNSIVELDTGLALRFPVDPCSSGTDADRKIRSIKRNMGDVQLGKQREPNIKTLQKNWNQLIQTLMEIYDSYDRTRGKVSIGIRNSWEKIWRGRKSVVLAVSKIENAIGQSEQRIQHSESTINRACFEIDGVSEQLEQQINKLDRFLKERSEDVEVPIEKKEAKLKNRSIFGKPRM